MAVYHYKYFVAFLPPTISQHFWLRTAVTPNSAQSWCDCFPGCCFHCFIKLPVYTIPWVKMNCLVGSQIDSVESKWTPIEFWYGVETSTADVETFRYELESAIYQAAISSMVWCTENGNRRVQEEAGGETYFLDHQGRRLGIMAISSAPLDEPQTDCEYCCS